MRRLILPWALLLAGCSSEHVSERSSTPPGVPPRYSFLYEGALQPDAVAGLWKELPYDSIALERQGCFGTCPAYKVTLRKGGRAHYEGTAFVERQGAWEGVIDIWSYGRLCYLIDELRFRELNPRYAASWTDAATVSVSVTLTEDPTPVAVSEYGGVGPVRLWAVELAIDGTVGQIRWAKSQ